jgi:mediator of RNA polymerase II transcription subunit 25
MRPSPLLSKRFFAPIMPVTKELKDDPAKLGFGQTANGGRRGMAALEGFVAAMEVRQVAVFVSLALDST